MQIVTCSGTAIPTSVYDVGTLDTLCVYNQNCTLDWLLNRLFCFSIYMIIYVYMYAHVYYTLRNTSRLAMQSQLSRGSTGLRLDTRKISLSVCGLIEQQLLGFHKWGYPNLGDFTENLI